MSSDPHDPYDQYHPIRPPVPLKGRGAVSNLHGRFDTEVREAFDDGWSAHGSPDVQPGADKDAPDDVSRLETRVILERAKSILTRNGSPDIPFNVSLNPYRGCEHGCVYCFARPTHSYLGLSPGFDFESRIYAKINAPQLLQEALAKRGYRPEPIAIGVNTDAYQPVERKLGITRQVLEILHRAQHPLAMITKSSLIERDIDLLSGMAARNQAVVAVTITTLDADLARKLEPRATTPQRRLRTIRALSDAGIPVSVSIAPVIPFITEPDLEKVLEAAVEAGAVGAHYIVLRLPWEVGPIFRQWLQAHFPERANRVMNRVREMHNGKDYDSGFGLRMRGEGIWADLIHQRFEKAAARAGIRSGGRNVGALDCRAFVRPSAPAPRDDGHGAQLDLF